MERLLGRGLDTGVGRPRCLSQCRMLQIVWTRCTGYVVLLEMTDRYVETSICYKIHAEDKQFWRWSWLLTALTDAVLRYVAENEWQLKQVVYDNNILW